MNANENEILSICAWCEEAGRLTILPSSPPIASAAATNAWLQIDGWKKFKRDTIISHGACEHHAAMMLREAGA